MCQGGCDLVSDRCPHQFMLEHVYGLQSHDRSFLAFHSSVHRVMAWAAEQAARGAVPEPEAVLAELAAEWEQNGLTGHWFEPTYRQRAEYVLHKFVERLRKGAHIRVRQPIVLNLGGRRLVVVVDEIEEVGEKVIWRRTHFGRPAESHGTKDHRPALFVAGHLQHGFAGSAEVRIHYPLVDREDEVTPTQRVVGNRTEKMSKLIGDIEAGKFDPKPSKMYCPSCPFVFICSSE